MADTEHSGLLATLKSALQVLREGLIIFLVLFVLIAPVKAANYLRGLGLDKLPTPIGDFDLSRMGQAAGAVDGAQREVSDAAAALQQLSPHLSQPEREKFEAVVSQLSSTAAQLKAPNQVLVAAVQSQSRAVTQAQALAPTLLQGWIYVGHVGEDKNSWQPASSIVQAASPAIKAGDMVTIIDDVYLRQDGSGPQRNLAPVVGVARAGQQVKVEDVGYTHSLRGGWFMWLKVGSQAA